MRIKPLLLILFLLVLFTRSLFSLNNDSFSSDESYFHLRQIDHISETGRFLYYGPLSNSESVFSPLFHYIFAFFYKILPSIKFLKFLNNLSLSLCVFLFFSVCRLLTKNDKASLFASFVFSFVPVFFLQTFNDLSPVSLLIPCILYLFLCLLKNDKRLVKNFLLVLVIASFLSPLIVIFIVAVIFFIILLFIENIKLENWNKELLCFSVFFVLWSQIVVYKRAFFMHGSSIIWQNIPEDLLNNFFEKISIFISVYEIGLVPLLFGTYVVFKYLFKEKSRETYLIMGFCLALSFMLWFKLIKIKIGLLFLGISLCLLTAQGVKNLISYLSKTKISEFASQSIMFSLIILFIITSFIPTVLSAKNVSEDIIRSEEIDAMVWLRNNSEKEAIVLAHPNYGFVINAVADRKSVINNDFILLKDSDELYENVMAVFKSRSIVEIVEILDKYDVDYIFISKREPLSTKELTSSERRRCFSVVFRSNNVNIIKRYKTDDCKVKIVR